MTITGVNLPVAAGIVAAIGDISRFNSPQKLVSYFGLNLPSLSRATPSAVFLSAINAKPDMTLVEIPEMFEAETGASFAASSVWRFIDRHAITFLKKKNTHAAEQDRRRRPRLT